MYPPDTAGEPEAAPRYLIGAGLLLAVYAVTAVTLLVTRPITHDGPLSWHARGEVPVDQEGVSTQPPDASPLAWTSPARGPVGRVEGAQRAAVAPDGFEQWLAARGRLSRPVSTSVSELGVVDAHAGASPGMRITAYKPSWSEASCTPSTRAVIFWNAVSLARSGEPCLGFSSVLNGEKPQSSVAPRCSTGM